MIGAAPAAARGAGLRRAAWTLAALPALALAATVALLVAGARSPERVFLVEARTVGAEITFRGDGNVWAFPEVVLCERRPAREIRRGGRRGSGPCDARVYEQTAEEDWRADWRDGERIAVETGLDGALGIARLDASGSASGGRVVVPPEAWRAAGAQRLAGEVAIGDIPATGQRALLMEGRYEAHARARLALGTSRRTDVVKSGPLPRGGRVEVWGAGADGPGPATVYGHVVAAPDADGLLMGVVSRPGDTVLRLSYFGGREPAEIRPDWIDHALANPALIALTVVLTTAIAVLRSILGVGAFVAGLVGRDGTGEAAPPPPSGAPAREVRPGGAATARAPGPSGDVHGGRA